jgi:hypothetical protein
MLIELLPCPFCGSEAKIVQYENFKIVGCYETSMLCPNPKLIVYKNKITGEYDYKYWNRRIPC